MQIHNYISTVCDLPFDASDEEDQVAVDFGAVNEFINVAGVHRLSCLQAARSYAITHWQNKCKHTIICYAPGKAFPPLEEHFVTMSSTSGHSNEHFFMSYLSEGFQEEFSGSMGGIVQSNLLESTCIIQNN